MKFKKVVDFKSMTPIPQEVDEDKENSNPGQEREGGERPTFDIEERIHINYRLQYLKDTVMARYIDEQAVNFINQLIMANNREIVAFIFGTGQEKTMKDIIIDKIRDKSDMV